MIISAVLMSAPTAQAIPLSSHDEIKPMTIAEITTIDPLGYSCIDAKHLEETEDSPAAIAFSLSGKVRMPRTCLPEPCARALTQRELSNLTGTEMILPRFRKEWDEYYARYADFCRKEVVPFGRPAPIDPMTPEAFWPPLLSPPVTTDDLITGVNTPTYGRPRPIPTPIFRPNIPFPNETPNGPGPTGRRSCNTFVDGTSMWVIETDPSGRTCRAGGGTAAGSSNTGTPTSPPLPLPPGGTPLPIGTPTTPPITPVPLPGGLVMLLTALGGLGAFKARLKRKSTV